MILFVSESWLTGAISTIGTIANGAGMMWAVNRRTEAVKEEEEAYKDVEKHCPAGTIQEYAAKLRAARRLWYE